MLRYVHYTKAYSYAALGYAFTIHVNTHTWNRVKMHTFWELFIPAHICSFREGNVFSHLYLLGVECLM